jgi:hypothetical protein
MASVQVTSEITIDVDQLLRGVAQLETSDLERFVEQVNLILSQRKTTHQVESQLLQRIRQSLPETTHQRYNQLSEKLRSETIAPDEHQELLSLIDVVEQANVDRLQCLVELAQLRQISLNDLMKRAESGNRSRQATV